MLQMGPVVVSLTGTELLESEHALICHEMTAGIILFARNYESNNIKLLKILIADIQNIAIHAGKKMDFLFLLIKKGGMYKDLGADSQRFLH